MNGFSLYMLFKMVAGVYVCLGYKIGSHLVVVMGYSKFYDEECPLMVLGDTIYCIRDLNWSWQNARQEPQHQYYLSLAPDCISILSMKVRMYISNYVSFALAQRTRYKKWCSWQKPNHDQIVFEVGVKINLINKNKKLVLNFR